MIAELIGELLVRFRAMEERAQAQRQRVNPAFWSHRL
jgi:hypothetical protein